MEENLPNTKGDALQEAYKKVTLLKNTKGMLRLLQIETLRAEGLTPETG